MRNKRLVGLLAGAGLSISLFAVGPALADGHELCGGEYHASVEIDPGQGTRYCSDGTLNEVAEPDEDGTSSCGGQNVATIEVQNTELPEGAPIQSFSYCSDGTIEGIEDLLP